MATKQSMENYKDNDTTLKMKNNLSYYFLAFFKLQFIYVKYELCLRKRDQ